MKSVEEGRVQSYLLLLWLSIYLLVFSLACLFCKAIQNLSIKSLITTRTYFKIYIPTKI